MKLFDIKLKVTRKGYVKDEDELEVLAEDAHRICDNYLQQLCDDLDQAGFQIEVSSSRKGNR